jgi:hypothetical protein
MRKPQSTFVVEYKGGLRQKRSSNTSIWGSVDFTSLAKEIEGDLPAEIGARSDVASDEADQRNIVLDQTFDCDSPTAEVEASSSVEESLPNDSATSSEQAVRAKAEGSNARDVVDARASDHYAGQSPGAQSDPDNQQANLASGWRKTRPTSFSDRVPRQELATLVAENVKLKAQLAQRLTAENFRLKTMLERFVN